MTVNTHRSVYAASAHDDVIDVCWQAEDGAGATVGQTQMR